MIRHLDKEDRDVAKIGVISEKEWIEHYNELWGNPNPTKQNLNKNEIEIIGTATVTRKELNSSANNNNNNIVNHHVQII